MRPGLSALPFAFALRAHCVTIAHWDLIRSLDRPRIVLMSDPRERRAYAIANKVPQDTRLPCTVAGWQSPRRLTDR